MSSGSEQRPETHATPSPRQQLVEELGQALRQHDGLIASFFRALAARLGVTVTDMQVVEGLAASGPMTAGQLADLAGLTTGAITGMINRLEESGLVQRERDPEDGRRVIVRLVEHSDQLQRIAPLFQTREQAWGDLTGQYDDRQLAMLVDFFKRTNDVAQQEIHWLREAPQRGDEPTSAPLGDLTSARFVIPSGVPALTLRAGADLTSLYRAVFEGPMPEVKTKDGVVTLRYARRLWGLAGLKGLADVTLNAAISWSIAIHGGGSMITAQLAGLNLADFEVESGGSMIRLELPAPHGHVPIQISGAGSDIRVVRPAGVPARVRLKGYGSACTFDDQSAAVLGSDVRLQSPDYAADAPAYDIEVSSSGSMITITTT